MIIAVLVSVSTIGIYNNAALANSLDDAIEAYNAFIKTGNKNKLTQAHLILQTRARGNISSGIISISEEYIHALTDLHLQKYRLDEDRHNPNLSDTALSKMLDAWVCLINLEHNELGAGDSLKPDSLVERSHRKLRTYFSHFIDIVIGIGYNLDSPDALAPLARNLLRRPYLYVSGRGAQKQGRGKKQDTVSRWVDFSTFLAIDFPNFGFATSFWLAEYPDLAKPQSGRLKRENAESFHMSALSQSRSAESRYFAYAGMGTSNLFLGVEEIKDTTTSLAQYNVRDSILFESYSRKAFTYLECAFDIGADPLARDRDDCCEIPVLQSNALGNKFNLGPIRMVYIESAHKFTSALRTNGKHEEAIKVYNMIWHDHRLQLTPSQRLDLAVSIDRYLTPLVMKPVDFHVGDGMLQLARLLRFSVLDYLGKVQSRSSVLETNGSRK